MDRADFVHLVRLSEHASAEDSARYRRGVAAFAALGYLWVLACLGLAMGLIVWVAVSLGDGGFSVSRGWLLLFGLGLLWATVRALWVRFDEPDGLELSREEVKNDSYALAAGAFATEYARVSGIRTGAGCAAALYGICTSCLLYTSPSPRDS